MFVRWLHIFECYFIIVFTKIICLFPLLLKYFYRFAFVQTICVIVFAMEGGDGFLCILTVFTIYVILWLDCLPKKSRQTLYCALFLPSLFFATHSTNHRLNKNRLILGDQTPCAKNANKKLIPNDPQALNQPTMLKEVIPPPLGRKVELSRSLVRTRATQSS